MIFFDTETTGLGTEDKICSLSCIKVDDKTGEWKLRRNQYFNPEKEILKEASEKNGLTNEMLKNHPTFKEVLPKIKEFFKGETLVAHNAPFDVRMLNQEGFVFDNPVIDSCQLSRDIANSKGKSMLHRLDALCSAYGIKIDEDQLHNSLYDTICLARLYPRLVSERDRLIKKGLFLPREQLINLLLTKVVTLKSNICEFKKVEDSDKPKKIKVAKDVIGDYFLTEDLSSSEDAFRNVLPVLVKSSNNIVYLDLCGLTLI